MLLKNLFKKHPIDSCSENIMYLYVPLLEGQQSHQT